MRVSAVLLALVASASCLLFACAVPSATARAAQRLEQQRALKQFWNLRLDTNNDGRCTQQEYQTYMQWMDPEDMPVIPFHLLADRFAELDRDGDLSLTLPELCVSLALCTDDDVRAGVAISSFDRTVSGADASTAPAQVHLGVGPNYSAMLVQWAQNTQANASVQWDVVSRASSGSYAFSSVGSSLNYSVTQDSMTYTSLPLFSAWMDSLSASQQIFYRVGNPSSGWSPEYSFVSLPDSSEPQAAGSSAKIIVVGDMGTTIPMGATVCQWIEAELADNPGYNLTLHAGDLAYAGVNSHGEWEPTWDAWMSQISPIAAELPYVTPVGNHEQYFNYTSFLHRFSMPAESSQGLSNFWFSFDFENIHFASISTENDTTPGGEMYEWLLQDLSLASERPNPPLWIVLTCHRPLYSSDVSEYATHAPGSKFLQDLEPLLQKFGVALVLTGHMHMYERSYPVFNGTVINSTASTIRPTDLSQSTGMCSTADVSYDRSKPVDIYSGSASAPIYIVQGTAGAMQFETLIQPQPVWSAFRLVGTYGFGTLSVSTSADGTCSTILYQFLGGADRTVTDQFIIQRAI